MAAVKLAGFLILLGVIFVCAHVIGGLTGPVTTGHSPAQPASATAVPSPARSAGQMPGMDMGGQP